MIAILDENGNPHPASTAAKRTELLRQNQMIAKRSMVRAKYDAAQTIKNNENHWANADNLDPHQVASISVRRTLRSRSRYEVLENNAFLQGIMLTKANDFAGLKGPRLSILDKKVSRERQLIISQRFKQWAKAIDLRQKLWRMSIARPVDGESFMRAYRSKRNKGTPVQLNFQVLECDRVSSNAQYPTTKPNKGEVDGVRFNKFEEPTHYHILHTHPGGTPMFSQGSPNNGDWVNEKYVVHWYRKPRGWLRGIPETTASLPLCAILRRYTIATLLHSEVNASITGFIETDGPPTADPFTGADGELLEDDPFDTMPIVPGMMTNLPYGYKWKQGNAVPLGAQYDHFVGSILREIVRPLMVPFGLAVGTHQDSNMASAVVDQHLYQGGIKSDRAHCEEDVLEKIFELWWEEAIRIPGYLGDDYLRSDYTYYPPEHVWNWPRVGLDHTDPAKIANALETLGPNGMHFYTDRDLQEGWHNRTVEEWQEEVKADREFRLEYLPTDAEQQIEVTEKQTAALENQETGEEYED